ncbi:MAG: hypothetical protein RIC80_00500 [Cyclobacteriaceae bacterium]
MLSVSFETRPTTNGWLEGEGRDRSGTSMGGSTRREGDYVRELWRRVVRFQKFCIDQLPQ